MKEIEVVIDTKDIADFFYKQLIIRGYVPSKEEVEELADITFDYLLEKCMIDEMFDEVSEEGK
ncbi:MAG: YozD family protein [Bacillaceae bacterium]